MKQYPRIIMYTGLFCILMALLLTEMRSAVFKLLWIGIFCIAISFLINGVEDESN